MYLGLWELKPFLWDLLGHLHTSARHPSLSALFDQLPVLGVRILRWSSFL